MYPPNAEYSCDLHMNVLEMKIPISFKSVTVINEVNQTQNPQNNLILPHNLYFVELKLRKTVKIDKWIWGVELKSIIDNKIILKIYKIKAVIMFNTTKLFKKITKTLHEYKIKNQDFMFNSDKISQLLARKLSQRKYTTSKIIKERQLRIIMISKTCEIISVKRISEKPGLFHVEYDETQNREKYEHSNLIHIGSFMNATKRSCMYDLIRVENGLNYDIVYMDSRFYQIIIAQTFVSKEPMEKEIPESIEANKIETPEIIVKTPEIIVKTPETPTINKHLPEQGLHTKIFVDIKDIIVIDKLDISSDFYKLENRSGFFFTYIDTNNLSTSMTSSDAKAAGVKGRIPGVASKIIERQHFEKILNDGLLDIIVPEYWEKDLMNNPITTWVDVPMKIIRTK